MISVPREFFGSPLSASPPPLPTAPTVNDPTTAAAMAAASASNTKAQGRASTYLQPQGAMGSMLQPSVFRSLLGS